MAQEKIADMLKTDIDIDVTKAENSLKKLQSVVKDSTSEWKQMESQMKQSGDTVGASEAKYKGLSNSVEHQKNVIAKLRYEQQQEKRDTEDSERSYQRYNTQITQAERKLTSMTNQLKNAERSYELQKSGIMSLNKEIQQNVKETDAQVERLKAEGKASEANKVKHEGLSKTIEQQNKLYKAQKDELDRMVKSGNASSDSISKQRVALERTGKELADNKNSIESLNSEMRKTSPNPFVRMSEKIKDTNKQATKTHSIFKQVFSANVLANVAGSAWRSMTMHIGDAVHIGNEYLEQQDKMGAQWKTLAGSAKGAKAMVDGINDLATAAQNSAEMVNGLASQFYAIDKNKDHVLELSKATLTLQDAFGATDDAVQNFGQQWSQMMANGKVSAQDFMSFTNVFPALKPALLDYEKDVTHNSNLTMKQLNDMISQGKISSETMNKVLVDTAKKNKSATENFGKTIPGMTRSIQATMPKLIGEIEKPFYKMKNPLVGSISTWVTDKNTAKEFNKLGKAVTEALDNITDAFGGKKLDAGNALDGMLQGLTKSVQAFGKWTKTHKDDIKAFFGNFKEKSADTLKIIASAMQAFAVVTTPLIKLMASHPKVAGTFIAGFMVAKQLTGPIAMMGAMAKATHKMLNSFSDDDGIARKGLSKLNSSVSSAGRGIKKSLKWTASLATKGFQKGISALKTLTKTTGRVITKSLHWTASVATKAYKLAMAGLVKTAKVTGNGIKLAFNFLKANPLILLITGITATVVALTTLYKHNKKFRNFVNGLVKSAQNFFKGISKWFGQAYKKVMGFFKAVLKFVKKDWKELLLYIVNPFAGAFALVYKHNAKFRKAVNNLVKSVINFFKNMGKNVINTFKDMVNRVANFYRGLFKILGNISNSISKAFVKSWNGIKNFFGDIWSGMKKIGHDAIWSIKNTFDSVLGKISRAFSNTWNGIKSGFKSMWDGMRQLAGDGINAVIGIPNAGISGINGLIHDFGGPKHAIGKIPKVAFATGTGAFSNMRRAITKPTLAVLNDGNDSPATGNREMLIHPNGQSELVEGRNTQRILAPGTEVLNATETAMMMGMIPTHFAGGTGFWSRVWSGVTNVAGNAWDGLKNGVKKFTSMLSFITNAVAHPVKTLEGKMSLKTDSLDAVYQDFGSGFFKKVKGQAKDWWKTLWNMASESSEAGASAGMKGDDYRFKDRAPDSGNGDPWGYFFKECVSFVASRLANLGVPAGKFSHLGNGRDWVNAKVPHMSKPKVGSVAVYSNGSEFGNHVAMVTGVQGGKISGEEYNWNGNHAYHQYHGRNASGATTFLDFGLGGGDNTTEVKADSPLAKLIKKQTGGMMKWISKFIAPLNADSGEPGSGTQALPSGGHKNWLKQAGITGDFDKWNFIINHESGWNPRAQNPSSSAYGIGQALPPSKMASFGSDYMTNPITQLKWMKSYVNGRYGGINGAYKWWKSHNWYANGGIINQDSIIRVAEENKPEMVIPLASEKKSRANQLLTEANQRINGNGQPVAESADLTHLEQSVDNLVSIVSLLLGVNQEQLKALSQQKGGVGIDGLLNQMANRQSAHNYQAI